MRGNIKTRRRHEKQSLRTARVSAFGLSLTPYPLPSPSPMLLLLPLKRRFSFRLCQRRGLSLCYFCANETSRALTPFLTLRLIKFLPRFSVTLTFQAPSSAYKCKDITKQGYKSRDRFLYNFSYLTKDTLFYLGLEKIL